MSHQPQITMHTYRQFRITISHNLPTARLWTDMQSVWGSQRTRREPTQTCKCHTERTQDRLSVRRPCFPLTRITQRKRNTHLKSFKFYCDIQTSTDLCRLSKSVFTPVITSPPLSSSYLKTYSWFAFSREMLEVTKSQDSLICLSQRFALNSGLQRLPQIICRVN